MKSKRISNKKRRELNRTGKMECPICKSERILVQHHINGRKIPNAEHPSNKVDICDSCHREVHEGLVEIEGWFMTTGGKELIWHKKGQKSLTGNKTKPHIIG
jgi:hypothetical protein